MAAVGTITITGGARLRGNGVSSYSLLWTSNASGAVSGIPTGTISGTIERVVFAPGAGGVQPSDAYDVTLLDASGIDVLSGQGANLSQSTATQIRPGVPFKDGTTTTTAPIAVNEPLQLVVANAGNAKQGTVVLYVR